METFVTSIWLNFQLISEFDNKFKTSSIKSKSSTLFQYQFFLIVHCPINIFSVILYSGRIFTNQYCDNRPNHTNYLINLLLSMLVINLTVLQTYYGNIYVSITVHKYIFFLLNIFLINNTNQSIKR